jgi:hypothetical protein
MLSLANAIEVARSRKRMPYYAEGSTRDLARKLDVGPPVSIKELNRELDRLPPDYVRRNKNLEARFVHASGSLFLQSDGAFAFSGQAREEGFFGSNFLLTATVVDVKDAQGRALTFAHSDSLAGKRLIGFSDKNWTDYGMSTMIADQWEQARSSPVKFYLHVSTDPLSVTQVVVGGLLLPVIGAVVLVLLADEEECPPGKKREWRWETVQVPRPEHPEDGSEGALRRECR